ncbi:MAG: ester cyclase [Thermodesulfobacteriota bacterium]|jgi:steroid delta-isomerase-like uncharacterized protein
MKTEIDLVKKWLAAMNKHNVDQMSSLCSEDAVGDEVADPPPAQGRDQIAKSYRELFKGFSDSKAEILNIFSGKGQVLAEVRWSGTNRAQFRGTPATGRFVDIRIAYVFKIEKGKIRRITEYYDGATVATQMGLS